MLVSGTPNLEKLVLMGDNDSSIDEDIVIILSQLQKLKYIELNQCIEDSSEAYTNILKKNNPNLKVVIEEIFIDRSEPEKEFYDGWYD